jgi:hypothetical protein
MSQRRETGGARVLAGWVACAIGLFCTLWGVFHISIAYEVLGILFGAAGYVLRVRRFGVVTIVISAVSLEFVLAAAQGYIPSIEPTDPRSRNP